MDWTPWIGRHRPIEDDALRILAVVHQLGEPSPEAGFNAFVSGERHLQWLDHLVRRPIDLAFVLIAGHDPATAGGPKRPAALPRDVRRLVAGERALQRLAGERLHRFQGGAWERWDDVWTFLGCRQLAEVRAGGEPALDLEYWLSDHGVRHLEGLYASTTDFEPYRERCRVIQRHLADGTGGPADLETITRVASHRLDDFRLEEQLTPEDDLLSRFFHRIFGEHL